MTETELQAHINIVMEMVIDIFVKKGIINKDEALKYREEIHKQVREMYDYSRSFKEYKENNPWAI